MAAVSNLHNFLVAFLAKYYGPEDLVGIDISSHQIKFAQQKLSENENFISSYN